MKIHIGAGSVYLTDYVNIDVRGPNIFLASDRPDLVEKLQTSESNYYGKHQDKTIDRLRQGPLEQEMVVDAYGSFDNIPAAYWSVSEVLTRHAFEHLSIGEAHKALDAIDEIMEPNGILRIDVPDHTETVRLLRQTGDAFYERHLLGPRRNEFGYHLCGYSRERLTALVESHGFVLEAEEPNIHWFPAFCLNFRKPGPRAPRDYVKLPEIPDSWSVLDVGPGAYPHPRANTYLDCNLDNLRPLQEQGKQVIIGNLMEGLSDIPDKAFDYVWCSHALEHVPNPERAAAALSRIAKRGTVVLPSTFKEMMFCGEEEDHRWQTLPNPANGGPPIFIRNNSDYMKTLRDSTVQKITSRLYRTGPNRHEEARYLRKWFYENEEALDVVHHWTDELKLQVIG